VRPRQRRKRDRSSKTEDEFQANDDSGLDEIDEDVEDITRETPCAEMTLQTSRSLPPDLAVISPIPLSSPTLEFQFPLFSEFSSRPNRRALVDHFCNVLSHLIVFREESGNPWQQMILPLSYQSPPIMNAIYALASAHLEYRGVDTGEKSMYFHHEAIQGLTRLIEIDGAFNNKVDILAAIMLLVYYEVVSVNCIHTPKMRQSARAAAKCVLSRVKCRCSIQSFILSSLEA
jgi:hypothetical protein